MSFIFFLLFAGSASAQSADVAVPEALKPAAGETLAMVVPAKGVQIYECRPGKSWAGGYWAGGYEWAFVAPEAELFDAKGHTIGRHYAGPHWESVDGSRIVGSVQQRADAPAAGSIPWLLLGTKSVGGEGAFSKVTSIQRVSTAGGAAPAAACDQAGSRVAVPYTADYYFFTAR
jgi:hypothetical protein